jgi:hypothetical protein
MPTSLTQPQHFPDSLFATHDGTDDHSPVLATCDPRTPDTLTVHLATLWTTTTLSLPEVERLVRLPSIQVVISGEPGRGAVYLPSEQAERLLRWLRRLDAERTQPPRHLPT